MAHIGRLTSMLTTWNIDPSHSVVEFSARHIMITTVKGRFRKLKGVIRVDEADPDRSTVEVSIETRSIDTGEDKRDTHLRSVDFLDAEHHPTIWFRSRSVDGAYAKEGDHFKVTGDLIIRGVSREVVLDVIFEGRGRDPWGGERASFSAETQIDRREFGLTWNQALEYGGVLVSNDVKVALEVQAVRQQ
jgi:polyisoprenoid-binding protein YceI